MGSPDPPVLQALVGCEFWKFPCEELVSAAIERGSYPFPSRTRKSSLASPMVPGPRIRESRSPLDSRGPLPRRQGASSFFTGRSACGSTLAITAGRYRPLMAHSPLDVNVRGGFSLCPRLPGRSAGGGILRNSAAAHPSRLTTLSSKLYVLPTSSGSAAPSST